ncbi:hypothetical protein CYMTET_40919 [Cymbomonas tetramitiformis]|uniref:Uncharacterized protein n=1 Tax=Cymbomonas tetramitiformis TaxID=36881 RepID=A0AAE0F318_9CHLO|nr:hypothetical protein CYMTET_40919 [Cymbomonas tetramitiformis]
MRGHILDSTQRDGKRAYVVLRCDRCDSHACSLRLPIYRCRSRLITRDLLIDAVPTELPLVAYSLKRASEREERYAIVNAYVPKEGLTVAHFGFCLVATCEELRRTSCSRAQMNLVAQLAPNSTTTVSAKHVNEARRKVAQWRQDRFTQTIRRAIETCAAGMWVCRTQHATPAALVRFCAQYGKAAALWWLVSKAEASPRVACGDAHFCEALALREVDVHDLPLDDLGTWPLWAQRALSELDNSVAHAEAEGHDQTNDPALVRECLRLCVDRPVCVWHARVCALPMALIQETLFEMCEPVCYERLAKAWDSLQTRAPLSFVIVIDARSPALRITIFGSGNEGGVYFLCTQRWTCDRTWRRCLRARVALKTVARTHIHCLEDTAAAASSLLADFTKTHCAARSESDVVDCSAIMTSGRVVVECAAAPRNDGLTCRMGCAETRIGLRAGAWARNESLGMDCRVLRVHSLRSFATGVQGAAMLGNAEPCIVMLEAQWRGPRNEPACTAGVLVHPDRWTFGAHPSLRVMHQLPTDTNWSQLNLECSADLVEEEPSTWLCLVLRANCARVTIYPLDEDRIEARDACERLLLEARTELEYERAAVCAE